MRNDKFGIWVFVSLIIFLIPIVCLLPRTMAETSAMLTLIYSGEEQVDNLDSTVVEPNRLVGFLVARPLSIPCVSSTQTL